MPYFPVLFGLRVVYTLFTMSEGEAVDIGLSLAQKDVPERSPLVAAEREFKSSISARDLAHFDKLYRRGKTERIAKEYARFSEKKTAELQDLLDRGK